MTKQAVGRLTPSLPILLMMLFTVSSTKAPQPTGKPGSQETHGSQRKLDQVNQLRLSHAYEKLPLRFEANQGQTSLEAEFVSRAPGYTLFLTPREAVFSMSVPRAKGIARPQSSPNNSVLRMKLVGASQKTQVVGLEPLHGKSNYFVGNDPQQWQTDVPQYGKVQYNQVYPGIDLLFYGNQNRLEFDFVVAPNANPEVIRLSFEGAEQLSRDESDNIVVQTASGNVLLQAPLIHQESQNGRRKVAGRYLVKGKREVSFHMASYDVAKPLIIDLVLVYSTYLGGSGEDGVYGMAVDSGDAYVAKFSPTGSLLYSTYLGGNVGHGGESGYGIAVDTGGKAYVTGVTTSSNFPTTSGAYDVTCGTDRNCNGSGVRDAFVAKVDPAGNGQADLMYSTIWVGVGLSVPLMLQWDQPAMRMWQVKLAPTISLL